MLDTINEQKKDTDFKEREKTVEVYEKLASLEKDRMFLAGYARCISDLCFLGFLTCVVAFIGYRWYVTK